MSFAPYQVNTMLPSPADIEIMRLHKEIEVLENRIRNLEGELISYLKKEQQ